MAFATEQILASENDHAQLVLRLLGRWLVEAHQYPHRYGVAEATS